MRTVLMLVLLGQATQVIVTDPTYQNRKVTTTTAGAKTALDINCVSGCGSGGSGGSGGTTIVLQGSGQDGGLWQTGIVGTVGVNVQDAGVLNVNFPVSQTVNGSVTVLQGPGSDGGLWQVAGAVSVYDAGVLNVNPVAVSSLPPVYVYDSGVLNVNFPASQTVSGSVTVLQGPGSDGGQWQTALLTTTFNITDAGVLNVNPHAVSQGTSPWVVALNGPTTVADAGVLNINPPTVNQGTSPWVVALNGPTTIADAGVLNINPVNQGTSPWVVSLNGPTTVADAGVLNINPPTVNQGTSPWVVSLNGPTTVADAGVLNINPPTVNQGTSPWVVSLNGPTTVADAGVLNINPPTVNQGTSPWVVSLNGPTTVADAGVLNVNPIAVSSLPLATGASTDATLSQLLDGGLASLAAIAANQTNGTEQVVITIIQRPLNPFLPRCNAVRRANCQP